MNRKGRIRPRADGALANEATRRDANGTGIRMVVTRGRTDQRRGASGSAEQPKPEPGTRVQLRRGQRISIEQLGGNTQLTVQSGCLLCEAQIAPEVRHILMVLYPSDVFRPAFAPPLAGLRLHVVMPSIVIRQTIAGHKPGSPAASALDVDTTEAATARLLARSCLYAAAMGRLTAEERLGTLLTDLALHLGRQEAGGYGFELPLSRRDMADHLALNPDSLSRLISRFRERGLLTQPTRTRAIARSLEALMATTPLADVLLRLRAKPQV